MNFQKIGLGGGCHWCTEAVFQSLNGVSKVEQGYIGSTLENESLSEAIIVHYNSKVISLKDLIEIHLHTHQSTSDHRFRKKYRSAVYYFEETTKTTIEKYLLALQVKFDDKLITQALIFKVFTSSRAALLDYYKSNPEKPFCKKYIHPKLELLKNKYPQALDVRFLNQ